MEQKENGWGKGDATFFFKPLLFQVCQGIKNRFQPERIRDARLPTFRVIWRSTAHPFAYAVNLTRRSQLATVEYASAASRSEDCRNLRNKRRTRCFSEMAERASRSGGARSLLDKTIAKIRLGNLGHHKSVGEGLEEIVLDYGPGYRIYFGEHGTTLIVLLLGSTKRRQDEAIKLAKRYWND
jgi:putative addiction module killer protein